MLQAEYKYGYLGRQYSQKLVPSNTTIHSVYGPDGKRISEYNEGTGALIRQYVWFDGRPVAVIEGGRTRDACPEPVGRQVPATAPVVTPVMTAAEAPGAAGQAFAGVRSTPLTRPI